MVKLTKEIKYERKLMAQAKRLGEQRSYRKGKSIKIHEVNTVNRGKKSNKNVFCTKMFKVRRRVNCNKPKGGHCSKAGWNKSGCESLIEAIRSRTCPQKNEQAREKCILRNLIEIQSKTYKYNGLSKDVKYLKDVDGQYVLQNKA
jgi:hypothetical protein